MRLLTADEVKREYNIAAKSTIYAMAASGVLPSIRFGKKHVRFPAEAIEKWLAEQVTGGADLVAAAK